MGRKAPTLTVIYSAAANKEIQRIWRYNADFYASAEHATNYVTFLYDEMDRLATDYLDGRSVESNPVLRYMQMKRTPQGHGHIAVYRITRSAVRILHVFHTAQDWQQKVKPRKRS